jgi:hypothetical protein
MGGDMNLFECVTRCFVNGRIYEKGETLRVNADKLPHFRRIEKRAVKPDKKRDPKGVKPDILE